MTRKKIKVLIIDDSAVIRQSLRSIFESDKSLEVVGTATDPFAAAQKISQEIPDVITLDVEMPRMDGLTFLKKIMSQHPIPVVIISSLTAKGTDTAIQAMELGAVDVIKKPAWSEGQLSDEALNIIAVVKGAAKALIKRRGYLSATAPRTESLHTGSSMIRTTEKIVAVGASTGGTEAIRELLQGMPIDCPGLVIVQHMPEHFTKSFADRLDTICKITVKEAVHGDSILRGQALIAPGSKHLQVCRSGARYYVEVQEGPPVNRHRPSVDVLFLSAAKFAGRNAIGVILTGMGADGAKGLLEMKNAGAKTVAQDEASSIVFGMPREAIKLNAAGKVLSLNRIAGWVIQNA